MASNLSFRLLSVAPAPKMLKAFRRDAGWSDGGDAALNGAFAPGSRVQWAAVVAGQTTIGIVRLELAPPQFCYLSELVILAAHRGRGVGEWFMAQIEQLCRMRGIDRIVLQPNDAARGFYDRRRYVPDPLVAGFVRKDIHPPLRKPAFPFAGSRPGARPG